MPDEGYIEVQQRTRGAHGFGWTWKGIAAYALDELPAAKEYAAASEVPCRVVRAVIKWEADTTYLWERAQGPADAATCPTEGTAMLRLGGAWQCPECGDKWPV